MWLGQQTVSSFERCPLFRVSFIESFYYIYCAKIIPPNLLLHIYILYIDTFDCDGKVLCTTIVEHINNCCRTDH